MLKKWKILDSKPAFDNKWMRVIQEKVELPTGKILDDYFMWVEGQIVLIVPVTENNELVMVRQYKHAYGEIAIEFPAGWVDENEDIKSAAIRELQEETGYSSENLYLLKEVVNNPTKVRSSVRIFLAENAIANKQTAFDENEEIETIVRPYQQVAEMIYDGEIVVTGTIAAFFLAAKKMGWKV